MNLLCPGADTPHCVDEAITDMDKAGAIIDDFATYQYEEDLNFNIMLCGIHERVIHSSRVYYRLVLPVNSTRYTALVALCIRYVIVA